MRDTLTVTDAWICRSVSVVRLRIEDDRPVFLGFSSGSAASAIGGLDLIGPEAVTALRVICDGMMTYVSGRLRLDMASTATLLLGTAPDRQDLDDRLCDLAVELVRPGGYEQLRSAGCGSSDVRIRCNATAAVCLESPLRRVTTNVAAGIAMVLIAMVAGEPFGATQTCLDNSTTTATRSAVAAERCLSWPDQAVPISGRTKGTWAR